MPGGFCAATLILLASVFAAFSETSPRAAVFLDPQIGGDELLAREIAAEVSESGYAVEFISTAAFTNSSALSTQRFDLLVLPGARRLPALMLPVVETFLREGGDLLALGLPAWDEALFKVNGSWISRSDFDAAEVAQKPQRLIFDFARADLSQWRRSADDSSATAHHEIVAAGHGKALHVVIGRLSSWDTFASPPLTNPFPPGHTLTCFRARGTTATRQLALEWTEQDGSRWIATVNLTPEWKSYTLPPEAFKPWQPPPTRRDKDDRFRPENAAQLSVGLARSHTAVEGVRQEYWLADVGTAASPFGEARLPAETKMPHLESLSPAYQFFPITTPVVVGSPGNAAAPMRTQTLLGIHPRPRGVGFNQDRAYRWETLLAAHDAKSAFAHSGRGGAPRRPDASARRPYQHHSEPDSKEHLRSQSLLTSAATFQMDAENNDHRGTIAALLVHGKPPFHGGVWAVFTPSNVEFYRQPTVRECLRQTLGRMRRGVFLIEGGTEFFTAFEDQTIPLGAHAVNFGREPQNSMALRVHARAISGKDEFFPAGPLLALSPGETAELVESWKPVRWPSGGWRVVSELFADGQRVDRISHDLHVWRPKAKPQFIETRDGGFRLRGRPWKINGVNYMPSSGIGLANWRHFEYWVGRGAYDPEVIERDLRRIRAMNMNAVSVFIYHESLRAQHLLDFLRRCEAHGLRVNLSLRPGTPMDFRWTEMRELIEHYRLAQNDTVFAYDLAWEPSHGNEAQQQRAYSELWRAWVARGHGSPDAAAQVWGIGASDDFKLEVADFKSLRVPPMKWLTQDGPWRRLAADYRQFLDELLAEKYGEARRLVRSIAPHQAVSFRMQYAGDPTFIWEALLAYDLRGLARAVDIWQPEAYGRIGDWEKVKPGRFTADYARLCDPAKPIIWAEMGVSAWDDLHASATPEKLEFAARLYRDYYRMLNESGVDGVFFWWYPGGYRLNERSDYGIINPDGTDRPVTKIIREQGGRFLKSPKPAAKPNHWITVNRDRDARGLFGIYEAVKDEYWRAVEDGKRPGLRWQQEHGDAALR